jgi:hypothetical protein
MSTLIVYADLADGFIDSSSGMGGTYATSRNGTFSLTANSSGVNLPVGQYNYDVFESDPVTYFVDEGFLSFDTSSIGSGATVTAAVLRVTSAGSGPPDSRIEARLHDWGTSLTTADWVAGASLSGKTLLAYVSANFVYQTGYDFTDVALPANVNKTGSTRLLLCEKNTVDNVSSNYTAVELYAYSSDQSGTTYDPKLTVTYNAARTPDGPGLTLDAVLSKTQTGSFTAAAVLKKAQTGSFTANAVTKKTASG